MCAAISRLQCSWELDALIRTGSAKSVAAAHRIINCSSRYSSVLCCAVRSGTGAIAYSMQSTRPLRGSTRHPSAHWSQSRRLLYFTLLYSILHAHKHNEPPLLSGRLSGRALVHNTTHHITTYHISTAQHSTSLGAAPISNRYSSSSADLRDWESERSGAKRPGVQYSRVRVLCVSVCICVFRICSHH